MCLYFLTMASGIYKIENNITHNVYIGKAKDFNSRWRQHKSEANSNKNNNHLYNAIRKYGIDNFTFSIVEEIPLELYSTISSEREKYWIKFYNAYEDHDNYNETQGGEGVCGWDPSQDWRDNMSKIKKEWYQTEEGKVKAERQRERLKGKAFFKNHTHTEEWKEQHSKDMQGEKNPNYGKHTQGKKCLCIELNKIFESAREAAKQMGVSHTGIIATCNGKQKTSAGYHWKYIED